MIAVIDLDSVMFSIGNPNKVLDSNGVPLKKDNKFVYEDKNMDQLVDSCEFIMNKILTNCRCDSYIAYIKGNNTTDIKRSIDPNYKMNRHGEVPKWWNFTKHYLIKNWGAIEVNNMEVDDAVNITRLNLDNSFMCCIDSDLLGLEGEHFNWKKNELVGEWITTSAKQAEYKFWSDMICGTHNNTKGIPGKGIKFTEELLSMIENPQEFPTGVLYQYIRYFGESKGIEEFYKNYKMIKILDKYEGFVIPEPIKYKENRS